MKGPAPIPLALCPRCGSGRTGWAGNLHNMVFCRACNHRAPSPQEWNAKRETGARV